jgi:hypothetical protein
MKQLKIALEHCYGIKALTATFNFSGCKANAIYAPNGAMKTSLARTFQDIAEGKASQDRIFPARATTRSVTDENGNNLSAAEVLVVRPYDEVFGHSEKTSTLLVNAALREEYEKLHIDIDVAKAAFLKGLRDQSGTKRDIEKEISTTFTSGDDQFYVALTRIEEELRAQKDTPLAEIPYDKIFDDKVVAVLNTKDFKTAIDDYIKRYNELLAASTYFKKGIFNYYHAGTIAKSLADNGFFKAKHSINLNADSRIEIRDEKELEALVAKEKEGISSDAALRKKYAEIEKALTKNITVRDFESYLSEHEDVLPHLSNVDRFKEDVWKSYILANIGLYDDLLEKFRKAKKRKEEIEEAASKERTQWQDVIDIFNDRFVVPFKLVAKNLVPVILGHEAMLSLGFTFEDGTDSAPVDKASLMEVLSTGEKKALYVLNIIFEIQTRIKTGQQTLLIVDDVADSFDYKNKYAIIEYLKDISEESNFNQIILTHNFDFFRTINSRFVDYSCCWMVTKGSGGITLSKASGIKNVFVNDWKGAFFDDPKKRVASIPFMRNLIEFTKGEADPDYVRLTSLLHWKADTQAITQGDLDAIYNRLFGSNGQYADQGALVIDQILASAEDCLAAAAGVNFENKIVLAIATRMVGERFMITKIAEPAFVSGLTATQTPKLLKRYVDKFGVGNSSVATLQRVLLMTPENIHLNSFMYEPILDMSDEHLRKLYTDVVALA